MPSQRERRSRAVTVAVLALMALSAVLVMAGCEDLNGSDTSSTAAPTTSASPTTAGPTTTSPAETTTTTEVVSTTEEPTTTTMAASTTTAPTLSTTTTEALSSAEERLPNGHIKAMGYIDDVWVDGGRRYLRIDYAEMITDHDEATAAAREAGDIGPTEEWDLDWYISNVNPLLREFRVSDSVAITTSTRWVSGDDMNAPCSWVDFLSFWGPGPLPESDAWMNSRPWWIERDGNVIVKIDEQYLP